MRGAQPSRAWLFAADDGRSPHARGSTGEVEVSGAGEIPIPACAGLNRDDRASVTALSTDPRMRGAQPKPARGQKRWRARSPHARGSTESPEELYDRFGPIPACAGLNRKVFMALSARMSDPRMRGAQPNKATCVGILHYRSPHARGSTGMPDGSTRTECPIPACAGLNRVESMQAGGDNTDPRMRGAQPTLF